MDQGKMKALESLEPAKLEWLLDYAAQSRLSDCVEALKEHGIAVSVPTLSRFVGRHRAKQLMERGAGLEESAEALRKRGKNGAFREATLEALRQRLFEKAIDNFSGDEELRQMYLDLVKEEGKLKELQLAERRVGVAEEQARLAMVKAQLALQNRPRKKVELLEGAEAAADAGDGRNGEARELEEFSGRQESAVEEVEVAGKGELEGLRDFVSRLAAVINGPGLAEEKVLAARGILAERNF